MENGQPNGVVPVQGGWRSSVQESLANITIARYESIAGWARFVVGGDDFTCLTDPSIGGLKPRDDFIP